MVFLKNNTSGSSESLQQKSLNLKQQDNNAEYMKYLNNKLLNINLKKDINTLAKHQETSSASAMTESAKESHQPKLNKASVIGDTKRNNNTAAITTFNNESSNPFTVKLEINIVVVALFAVALGLRLYAIDQPNSVV